MKYTKRSQLVLLIIAISIWGILTLIDSTRIICFDDFQGCLEQHQNAQIKAQLHIVEVLIPTLLLYIILGKSKSPAKSHWKLILTVVTCFLLYLLFFKFILVATLCHYPLGGIDSSFVFTPEYGQATRCLYRYD